MGPPLDTPLCGAERERSGAGAERVRKLNEREPGAERERGVKNYGRA